MCTYLHTHRTSRACLWYAIVLMSTCRSHLSPLISHTYYVWMSYSVCYVTCDILTSSLHRNFCPFHSNVMMATPTEAYAHTYTCIFDCVCSSSMYWDALVCGQCMLCLYYCTCTLLYSTVCMYVHVYCTIVWRVCVPDCMYVYVRNVYMLPYQV